ncbi:hypothetical protein ACW73L_17280 [Methylolobus aquaticus]
MKSLPYANALDGFSQNNRFRGAASRFDAAPVQLEKPGFTGDEGSSGMARFFIDEEMKSLAHWQHASDYAALIGPTQGTPTLRRRMNKGLPTIADLCSFQIPSP